MATSNWMTANGTLNMSKGLHAALMPLLDEPYRGMLGTAIYYANTVMRVVDAKVADELMDHLMIALPAIIDRLMVEAPKYAAPATNLLTAISGDTSDREERALTLDLNADDDEWPQAKGLTKTDLRDPMTIIDILRSIAKADGMDFADLVAEWGSVDRTAREYGLPWGDWMTEAYAAELQLA
jgi:hypothetical protein